MVYRTRTTLAGLVLLLVTGGTSACADDAAVEDGEDGGAEAEPDGGDDAPVEDVAAADDAGSDDVADDDGEVAEAIIGRVTFERRPISADGLAAPAPVPAAGVSVRLETPAGEVARTLADEDGAFSFPVPGTAETWVRAVAGTDAPRPADVVDFGGAAYAVRTDPFPGGAGRRVDVAIRLADNAGAFAIFDTLDRALAAAEAGFERTEPMPRARAHWERGRATPWGTSYLEGGEMWFLGGPDDTDEFDEAVIAHELGHFLQTVYPSSTPVAGWPHAGPDTDPRLAWQEGWATLFSGLSRDDPWYLDSVGDRVGIANDLGDLPRSGEFLGRPTEPMTQTLSEWLVAGAGWALYMAGPDPDVQRRRSLAVIRDWFGRSPPPDRALEGYDLVDFLDGYLCLHGGADAEALEAWLVVERGFPYDLAPACGKSAARMGEPFRMEAPPCVGKPGRPCRPFPVAPPEDGLDRGAVVTGPTGERFREVRVRAAVR